jgi:hypothetical protein
LGATPGTDAFIGGEGASYGLNGRSALLLIAKQGGAPERARRRLVAPMAHPFLCAGRGLVNRDLDPGAREE